METEIEKIKQERDEYLEGWKRARADFLNYKKEEGERMLAIGEYSKAELLRKVLPILDNLARMEKEIPNDERDKEIWKGFTQIVAQGKEFLRAEGVQEIESVGKPFDPAVHEAVGEGEDGAQQEKREGRIVAEEVEKGYMMHGKLLRPAKVIVTKGL